MQELDNKSTYPYDLSVRLLRVPGCNSNPCQNTAHAAALILLEPLLTRTPCVF